MNIGMVIGRCRPKGSFLVRPSDGGNTVLLSGSRTSFLRKRDLVEYDCLEEGTSFDIARRYQKSAPLPKQKKRIPAKQTGAV